jgi:hypothetical protein
MTYWDTSELADDPDFRARCTAALATEGHDTPEQTAYAWRWLYAGTAGFGDKYASAIAGSVPNPGRDPSVISDGDILSRTQQLMAGPESEGAP